MRRQLHKKTDNFIVIPAKAGIHTPAYRHAEGYRGSEFRPAPE